MPTITLVQIVKEIRVKWRICFLPRDSDQTWSANEALLVKVCPRATSG
jgi:hypothetical protein